MSCRFLLLPTRFSQKQSVGVLLSALRTRRATRAGGGDGDEENCVCWPVGADFDRRGRVKADGSAAREARDVDLRSGVE